MASQFLTIPYQNARHACISDCGTFSIIYKQDLQFTFYDSEGNPTQTLDVLKHIKASGNAGFVPYNGDEVTDVRLIAL